MHNFGRAKRAEGSRCPLGRAKRAEGSRCPLGRERERRGHDDPSVSNAKVRKN